jgi:acetyltransferase-like isoleucine patch superfamily enzyme
VLDYLSNREKSKGLGAKTRYPDATKRWVTHDEEPAPGGVGLYSREFVRRIVCGGYGGAEIRGYKKIVGDICWYLHFLGLAIIWLLAKLPIISSWLEIVARVYKRNVFGFFLRGAYYKAKLKKMGTDVIIDQGVEIWGAANVRIGHGCHLDVNARIAAGESGQSQHGYVDIGAYVHIGSVAHLAGRGGIRIGSYTAITAGSKIFSATNVGDNPDDPADLLPMSHAAPLHRQRVVEAPVIIGDHVFVGLNVCILPGINIGRGAIINSGATIARDVEPFQIIKGATMSVAGTRLPRTK